MMTKMGNDYIAKENIEKINKVLDENYLKEVNINEGLKELKYLKDKLKKHKLDFILYFYKECLREEAEKEVKKIAKPSSLNEEEDETDLVVTAGVIIFGMIALVWYGFSVLPIFNKITAIVPTILAIVAVCTVPPRIFSLMWAFQKYGEILDTVKDKLALLKERKEDLTLQMTEDSTEIKTINRVDSFIKLIISYKSDLELLNAEDQERIKMKLVNLGKEYMEYSMQSPKDGLELDEMMIKFNKRLIEIELEIERLKKNSVKQVVNESALEEAFGVDITKLDTSMVELDTGLEGPKLSRDLKNKSQFDK